MLILIGVNLRKRIRRFKQYVKFIDDNNYCSIKGLASAVNMLDKMYEINKVYFKELSMYILAVKKLQKLEKEVTDMTNELLRKNAEILKTSTIETAKEAERGIVDVDTLRMSNESLISTLDEILNIQTEGRQKGKEAELELRNIENQLKNKLLDFKY